MPEPAAIAVVIPAGPGEQAWAGLVPHLGAFGAVVLSHVSGAAPQTPESWRTVACPAGRSRQLNAGARATTLPWLLFLHADSRPDQRLVDAVRAAPPGEFIGYCALRYYDGPVWMRLNEWGAWLRSRLFGLPFGDQGMLLNRALFDRLGGFDEAVGAGEDHALVWAARHAGVPLLPLNAALATSARKYVEHGWWQTTCRHLLMTWRQAAEWRAAP